MVPSPPFDLSYLLTIGKCNRSSTQPWTNIRQVLPLGPARITCYGSFPHTIRLTDARLPDRL